MSPAQYSRRATGSYSVRGHVNFHGLRYVSERCELGEQREALLAVTIPEEKGSFLKFCQLLGGRSVTEFNYRFADAKDAAFLSGYA
ncbi:threonine dehydratase biosynthetic [Klebsiella aerogenes]|nr:threonine dehydratase biosynthetic [Klebsiella aerogenes]